MDFGSGEFYQWLYILEAICAFGTVGLFFHCLMMAGETGNMMWWIPLAILAGIAATPLIAWGFIDFWVWGY